jgi:glycosyltransferase involved in cell wall biosynthesis
MGKTVTHLIAGLGIGGAETMLFQLLSHRKNHTIRHRVISLGAEIDYEEPIKKLGIELIVLPFKKHPISSFNKIRKLIIETDILCCWMYHGNLIGGLAQKTLAKKNRRKIIWNIRHSNLDKGNIKPIFIYENKICARFLSKDVDVIAYNGALARTVHEKLGYPSSKAVVLDNGCDISNYYLHEDGIETLRNEINITEDKAIVLSVTKNDPIKDIPTFIKAFSKLHEKYPSTVAVMCGRGVDKSDVSLENLSTENDLEIGKTLFLLGMRHDVPMLLSGCDLYVLHSVGEAFPNTLIQAMACECLCVTTDVGDARRILDDDQLTAKPANPDDLCDKMSAALELPELEKLERKKHNRDIVINNYDINSVVSQYESLYE